MGRIYAALAGLVVLVGGFLALMFGVKKAGSDAAKAETQEKVIEKTTDSRRARRDADPDKLSRFDRK